MPHQFTKRDVQLVLGQLSSAIRSADTLNKIQNEREYSIAITHMQTAELWLQSLLEKTPESFT